MRMLFGLFILWAIHQLPQAEATSFISKSFPDSVGEAPIIVRGVIGMSYSDYVKEGDSGKRIYTYYELIPSEILKGSLPLNSMTVRQIGGKKEGMVMEVPGAAQFSRGEEVVLMLSQRNSDGSHDIRGLMMGKFTIQKVNGKEYIVGAGAITPDQVEKDGVSHLDDGKITRDASPYSIDDLRLMIQNAEVSSVSEQQAVSIQKKPPTSEASSQDLQKIASQAVSMKSSEQQSEMAPEVNESKDHRWFFWGAGVFCLLFLVLFIKRS